jgi:hypothetical protein
MTLTPEQLNDLVEQYCNQVVEEMSPDDMAQMLYELLVESFSYHTENEMADLICSIYDEDYYQQLVEDVTAEQPAQTPD